MPALKNSDISLFSLCFVRYLLYNVGKVWKVDDFCGCYYKKLWKLLIDKNMNKKDLQTLPGTSSATITKLDRNKNVNAEILQKICVAL